MRSLLVVALCAFAVACAGSNGNLKPNASSTEEVEGAGGHVMASTAPGVNVYGAGGSIMDPAKQALYTGWEP
jgi:hypothetical protein